MLKVGILGYGNLGKSLEKNLQNSLDARLCAIFSRRNLDNKLYVPVRNVADFRGKLDVMLVALGSYNDIEQNIAAFAPFDSVDSFDTHAKIPQYLSMLNRAKPDNLSLCAVGWDPGVLSIARGMFIGGTTTTFWGEGISQGHSNAIRSIAGVLDAVEITCPCTTAVTQAEQGKIVPECERHHRMCYVACVEEDRPRVEMEIRTMPHYFAGQKVTVHFVTPAEVRQLKQNTAHAGEIVATGRGFSANLHLQVENNTDFTAKIMLAYARAIPQLKRDGYLGAMSPFDIPLKYVADTKLV